MMRKVPTWQVPTPCKRPQLILHIFSPIISFLTPCPFCYSLLGYIRMGTLSPAVALFTLSGSPE